MCLLNLVTYLLHNQHIITESLDSYFLKHAHITSSCSTAPLIVLSITHLSHNQLHVNLCYLNATCTRPRLAILISSLWTMNSVSFFTGQVSLPCNTFKQLRNQLLALKNDKQHVFLTVWQQTTDRVFVTQQNKTAIVQNNCTNKQLPVGMFQHVDELLLPT